jgi:hypothetical protein
MVNESAESMEDQVSPDILKLFSPCGNLAAPDGFGSEMGLCMNSRWRCCWTSCGLHVSSLAEMQAAFCGEKTSVAVGSGTYPNASSSCGRRDAVRASGGRTGMVVGEGVGGY